MPRLPTVLLRHQSPQGGHFDWLLADPRQPQGPLWTMRVALPPQLWCTAKAWELTALPAHRRRYLVYEGPLSDDRGQVWRVDLGWFIPRVWTPCRIVVDLRLRYCHGRIEMDRIAGECWGARLRVR